MQTMQGTIDGPLEVAGDLEIDGTVVGDAIVRPDRTLQLRGAITGDLIIEQGGTAIIYGTVGGRIRKAGGTVVIVHPGEERAARSE